MSLFLTTRQQPPQPTLPFLRRQASSSSLSGALGDTTGTLIPSSSSASPSNHRQPMSSTTTTFIPASSTTTASLPSPDHASISSPSSAGTAVKHPDLTQTQTPAIIVEPTSAVALQQADGVWSSLTATQFDDNVIPLPDPLASLLTTGSSSDSPTTTSVETSSPSTSSGVTSTGSAPNSGSVSGPVFSEQQRQRDDHQQPQPFGYTTIYADPVSSSSSWGLGFGNANVSPVRRWSLADPISPTNGGSIGSACSLAYAIPSQTASSVQSQRPWTSYSPSMYGAGSSAGGNGAASLQPSGGYVVGGGQEQAFFVLGNDSLPLTSSEPSNRGVSSLNPQNAHILPAPSSYPTPLTTVTVPFPPPAAAHRTNMPPSFGSSRPSTSSSTSFTSVSTASAQTLAPTSSHGAAPGFGDFYGTTGYLNKRRTSIQYGASGGLYGLDTNGSTDTVLLPHASHHHHQHHQDYTRTSSSATAVGHHQNQQQQQEESNPFFFGRELQLLQAQAHRQNPTTSLSHHHHHATNDHPPIRRPSSGYNNSQPQTSQSSGMALPAPNESFVFYDHQGNGHTDLLTPPSTAGSSTYFDPNVALPRPPRTSPSVLITNYSQPPAFGATSSSSSGYLNPTSAYDITPPSTAPGNAAYQAALTSFQRRSSSFSNHPTTSPSNPHSPLSLIVPNPDPLSSSTRPHLCTHCNETFRRIHDAKRHAFGALGIKNYACMGGCGMTFKRSEGRARHWMREEVVGVGKSVTVQDFFRVNPEFVGVGGEPKTIIGGGGAAGRTREVMLWGGKGCEERHAKAMSGTMEEDRRLRNKARRERILHVGSGVGKNKKKVHQQGRGMSDDDEEEEEEDREDERPMTSGSMIGGGGSASEGHEVGPVRNVRTSHGVSPY